MHSLSRLREPFDPLLWAGMPGIPLPVREAARPARAKQSASIGAVAELLCRTGPPLLFHGCVLLLRVVRREGPRPRGHVLPRAPADRSAAADGNSRAHSGPGQSGLCSGSEQGEKRESDREREGEENDRKREKERGREGAPPVLASPTHRANRGQVIRACRAGAPAHCPALGNMAQDSEDRQSLCSGARRTASAEWPGRAIRVPAGCDPRPSPGPLPQRRLGTGACPLPRARKRGYRSWQWTLEP
ncbi:hypothetical protein SKAU_G00337750 [Synaphobranchus kaupii]|uniref:Uncharacterized protein n=1 Tax=Synaphobranchus kaupii TaxID=118154 RepID=A0A9Q1EMG3_SYNKA|nr:hypothetical protein SKAU_G00337750 [Synaphobranchus kaupii]